MTIIKSVLLLLNIKPKDKMLTKYFNSKMSINRREEAVHKMNEPPCYIESNSYWKKDDTAKKIEQVTSKTRNNVLQYTHFTYNNTQTKEPTFSIIENTNN